MLTISTYIKTHEKLLIFILAFGLIYFVSGRIENAIAAHDKANLTAQQSVLQAQADKNAQLAVQVQKQSALYQSLAEKVQAQNAALEQANVTLATALAKQQKTDNSIIQSVVTLIFQQIEVGLH